MLCWMSVRKVEEWSSPLVALDRFAHPSCWPGCEHGIVRPYHLEGGTTEAKRHLLHRQCIVELYHVNWLPRACAVPVNRKQSLQGGPGWVSHQPAAAAVRA